MRIVSLIPARAGSKSIKDKNVKKINGKPLIYYSISESKKCTMIQDTYLSSDSELYLKIGRSYGAKSIKRPKDISQDMSPTEECVKHFLEKVDCDIVVLIQATSPMIRSEYLEKAINKMINENLDSVVSVHKDHGFWWENNIPKYDPKNRPMRQQQESLYKESGMFYIFKSEQFLKNNCRIFGNTGIFVIPALNAIEIDDDHDFFLVSTIMERKNDK